MIFEILRALDGPLGTLTSYFLNSSYSSSCNFALETNPRYFVKFVWKYRHTGLIGTAGANRDSNLKNDSQCDISNPVNFFCPRRIVFVGDYEVAVMRSLFVCLFLSNPRYFLNQASEVHETLPVLFLCQ